MAERTNDRIFAQRLLLTMVSENSCQIASLKRDVMGAGLDADLRLKVAGHSAAASLRRIKADVEKPHIVFLDFTEDTLLSRRMLRSIAFGEKRSAAILAVMTLPKTEALLQSGEVDGGEATMFSATSMSNVLQKLAGPSPQQMLHSLAVLNRFGPVLVSVPEYYASSDSSRASA